MDPALAPRLVETAAALDELVEILVAEPRYGVDTEFHRERTYFPRLALLQLSWGDQVALVDPLAVDPAPLRAVLEGSGTAVMHAADQDLEVLRRACGAVPSTLFDTQVAAAFVGFSTPALSVLVERILDIRLPKASRLTDWLRRPLTDEQKVYAASDVEHLLALHDELVAILERAGRLSWATEECELLRRRGAAEPDPEAAWLRIKESRHLRGPARAVAQEVAAWRDRRAAAVDIPVRQVLPDLAIVAIAQQPPRTAADLRKVRGLDGRHLKGDVEAGVLAAVERGRELPAERVRLSDRNDLERDLRPAATLVSAWLAQLGRDLRIDPAVLGTRADIVAFLADEPDARLAHGWRHDIVGEPVRHLVDGEAALAFDGAGRLVLEARSGQTWEVDIPIPDARWL